MQQITYSLDSTFNKEIYNLLFKDSYSILCVDKDLFLTNALPQQVRIINNVLKALESVAAKGYLNCHNLLKFPVVSELLPSFVHDSPECEKIAYLNGPRSMDCYKWLYNLIILNLYYLCCSSIENACLNLELEDEEDLVLDLKMLERVLFSKLDASIRHHMRKRGISLTKTTYIGFDTEFINLNLNQNSLISSQIVTSSGLIVKIPKNPRYKLSSYDTDSNKIHNVSIKSKVFNFSKLESSLHSLVQKINILKNGSHDESMLIVAEGLKQIKGLKYNESEEHTLFNLPRSEMQPFFIESNKVKLKHLIRIASNESTPTLHRMCQLVLGLIKDISSKGLSLQNGKDPLLEKLYLYYNNYTVLEEVALKSDNQLSIIAHKGKLTNLVVDQLIPRINSEGKIENRVEKSLARIYLKDLFQTGQQVSVTINHQYFLISHLTQADLSMLSDFSLFKPELSIVNGSLVTMRNPLKLDSKNIHVRDTMLLAPGGSKSLAQIGRLYGKAYEKVNITQENLNDMQKFIKEDRDMFVKYAIRDALISLKHAL